MNTSELAAHIASADDELFRAYLSASMPSGGLRDGNGKLRGFTPEEERMNRILKAERKRRGI